MAPKSKPKGTSTRKRLHPLNAMKHNEISIVLGFGASALRTKINQISVKKRCQGRSASWHRFSVDFKSIWASFLEPKGDEKRSKNTSKKRPRKNVAQDGPKGPKWVDGVDRHHPFWSPGRSPPYWWVNPSSHQFLDSWRNGENLPDIIF